jgi:ABC-type branched-subunit amino acid transport system substrate-binding protein
MSEQQPNPVDLGQELRDLGEQIQRAINVARNHPQTKEFERTITQAINDLGSQINHAMKSAREDERIKQAEAQVKQAAQSIKEGGAKDDIERGLAKGVRALNEQIRKAIEEAEKGSHPS